MASPTKGLKHLQTLSTNWHNRSLSNVSATSDAATFHSAHDQLSNMELRPFSHPTTATTPQPLLPAAPLSSPKLSATKMSRQDSGYSETSICPSLSSTPRTSTSSTRRSSKRRTSKSSTRPSKNRASRSSQSISQLRTSTSGTRPSLSTHRTVAAPSAQTVHQPYKFFHFPTLTPAPDTEPAPSRPHPPPATIQYWTSDSTRRSEYAAIDAASKGVRGLFIRLVPDCILPDEAKRTKFHNGERDDAGSVRRYRLVLPEEKDVVSTREVKCDSENTRQGGLLRRWTSFGRGR